MSDGYCPPGTACHASDPHCIHPRCRERTLRLHGHDWDAKQLSVAMGFDALRMSMGGKPAVFTPEQIVLWLACVAGEHRRENDRRRAADRA